MKKKPVITGRGGPGRGQGRKAADGVVGVKRVNVCLDDRTIDRAFYLGDGNLSVGLRRAVDASDSNPAHKKSAG